TFTVLSFSSALSNIVMKRAKVNNISTITPRHFRRLVSQGSNKVLNKVLNKISSAAVTNAQNNHDELIHNPSSLDTSAENDSSENLEIFPLSSPEEYEQSSDIDEFDLQVELTNWSISHNINYQAINSLLIILKKEPKYTHLPSNV
ncbi:unnamed protein product, partial [Allacma fusca]